MRRPSQSKAFTLAELAVVIAIVGVLSALATVSVSALTGRARQQREIDDVEALLRKARNLARNERRCVRIDVAERAVTFTPLAHSGAAPFSCTGGSDIAAKRRVATVGPGVAIAARGAFFFDRLGGVVVDENATEVGQEIALTVTAPGSPPRTFVLTSFVGAGAIVRRG